MRPNPVKQRLARGEAVFGPMVMELTGPGLPQILAGAGADFAVYDMEAGCLDLAAVKNQVALARGLGIVPLVNVPWHDYHLLVRPLDCGAMGVMVPVVQNRAEAEAIVRTTHYPPAGLRGVAFGIAHDDYAGAGDVAASIKAADERTLVIVKIETAKGVEAIDGIAAVPGVDVVFVGHMDLSTSLGVPGDYDHPRFKEAVERVIAACRRHGKAGGCLVTDPAAGRAWLGRGFRFVIYSTDVFLLASALRQGIEELRAADPGAGQGPGP